MRSLVRKIPMQFKRTALALITVICVVSILCTHLLLEVSRLNNARVKLENEVFRLSQDTGDSGRRRLSETYEQVEPGSYNEDDLLVIYNRVPKTGSTSFAGIAYELCSRNRFHVLHVNTTKNSHTLSLSDQLRFYQNITEWTEKKPALYHGHFAYIEFSKFGVIKKPLYINVIRDPLDRMLSYYYFVRYGDDFRPYLKRRKSWDRETFDDCVEKDGDDCDPRNLWLQIPFFCGQAAKCRSAGSRWALEEAKRNLVNNYLVVGITEELGDFIAVLEATLPRFFKGAMRLYTEGSKSHLRKTANKITPKQETIAKIQESPIWKMENEFYEFAVEQFHFIKNHIFELQDGKYVLRGQRFRYEKIRPR